MALEYTIYCDGCGSIMAADGKSAAAARAEAQRSNWKAVRVRKKDLCGECNEQRLKDEAANASS